MAIPRQPAPADPPPTAEIVGLLAEDDRLRVVAALVLGAGSLAEVVDATGLAWREAALALDRLTRGGLVVPAPGGVRLAAERIKEAARAAATRPAGQPPEHVAAGPQAAPVLRSFVRDGRLVSIPAARSKRLVVLDWLAARFEPGRVYPEVETNVVLREVHPDYAALRRYLVDEGFLERRDGFYWRVGGTFEVD